ncbi:unnamed protein product [Linum trigynum]|uniref:Coiled-coil domain-containing protein 12 n=1 Tax=Linum trigynum TaxID=586398 RepID=A0AAV2G7J5_9ROSI
MTSEEDSIEQAAVVRRERLMTLKAAKELMNTPDEGSELVEDKTDQEIETANGDNQGLRFHNYVPQAKELQEGRIAPPVLPKFEDPVAAAPPPLEEKEDPFLNIAPKKPNWDLRRDVQKKLDKLDRRTQKALYKLMGKLENPRVWIVC